ncbi:hypothetical protein J5N97_000791 [Dioscorea zingiberensis]|uniref:Uncharacterized protein n=1 Tax=Dioscorea zingiberensis TaxID=325984 RepID=A0A9D5H2P8_9LILI|nr:hypothetical protein J5N97_000791 [Dioscorea zingiberensis]
MENLTPWLVSIVYNSQLLAEQRKVWKELSRVAEVDKPWLIVGDFNTIREISEKQGGNMARGTCTKSELFNSFIMNYNLSEPKFIGSPFTWCNNQRGGARIWARLDRVIVNGNWYDSLASYNIKHLAKCQSDHCPILIHCGFNKNKGKRPFRFANTWTQSETCQSIVQEIWRPKTGGNPIHHLNHKFCTLQKTLIKNCKKTESG